MIRVAINGFGRIGRNTFKAGFGRPDLKDIEFVAVNDLTTPESLAYLLTYDTVYYSYNHKVSHGKDYLMVDGKKILVFGEKDPANLPWKKLKIDIVFECTGIFRTKELAGAHLKAGAKKVIISAPAKSEGVDTILPGVNEEDYKKQDIIDAASCTTNSIAPVVLVMHEQFGVKKALMTTVHAYTADQKLVDAPHKDPRRGRAAAANIIPTTTGAAIATTKAIPDLKGLFDGMAIRVPVPCVSLSDITFLIKTKTTVSEVNRAFKRASKDKRLRGILAVTDEPLVSSDFIGNSYSAIVDLPLTKVMGGDLVKVVAWYDNEWAYSCRMVELAQTIGKL